MNSIHAEERRGDARVSTPLVTVAIAIKYPHREAYRWAAGWEELAASN